MWAEAAARAGWVFDIVRLQQGCSEPLDSPQCPAIALQHARSSGVST